MFFVTTALPKLEKLLDQSSKDVKNNSILLVYQFNLVMEWKRDWNRSITLKLNGAYILYPVCIHNT